MLTLVERMGDPHEVAAEFMTQIPLTYAGFWRRLAGFIIDMILIVLFTGLSGALFVVLSNSVPKHSVTTWENLWGATFILLAVISANAYIAMILAHYPLLEACFRQALGIRLLHLRVCTEEGLPIGGKRAILRRLSFYFEILPIDTLFIPISSKHQRGFDILARTIVIEESKKPRMLVTSTLVSWSYATLIHTPLATPGRSRATRLMSKRLNQIGMGRYHPCKAKNDRG